MAWVAVVVLAFLGVLAGADFLELTPDTWDMAVNGKNNVVVEFYAPWCPYCKKFESKLEQASEDMDDSSIVFARLNADRYEDFADHWGIHAYPTVELIRKGDPTHYEKFTYRREVGPLIEWIRERTDSDYDTAEVDVAPSLPYRGPPAVCFKWDKSLFT